jgi:hypothetical protein
VIDHLATITAPEVEPMADPSSLYQILDLVAALRYEIATMTNLTAIRDEALRDDDLRHRFYQTERDLGWIGSRFSYLRGVDG